MRFDELEMKLQIHIGTVTVLDLIGDHRSVPDEVRSPVSGRLLPLVIEDPPAFILVESKIVDGVVLVQEGHVPFAGQLRRVSNLLELPRETGLVRMQVHVFLIAAKKDGFQAVLERIASRQQGGARGGAVGIGETAGESHALGSQLVEVRCFE